MDPDAVREQIHKILSSQSFASKSQLRRLLEILAQNVDSQTTLKPDEVIRELWPAEVRTKRSSDVATEMNRLRHALDSYYEAEGQGDLIIISLPNRSVTSGNGRNAKRWIEARPRGDGEEPTSVPPLRSRSRLKWIGGIAGVAAALSLGTVVAGRMLAVREQPKFARLEGSILVVMNAEGKELWRKGFPDGFWQTYYNPQPGTTGTRVFFADLEGKGRTSVLFLHHPGVSAESRSTTLICYSDRGKERWRWTPGRALPQFAGSPATFVAIGLAILKATEQRPVRIVVSSQHSPWWEDQIALLDTNGKMISEYWHSGAVGLTLADLDGDGREEIVAYGTNNDYLQATLVVLDPDRVFGASAEVRPQFQIQGMAPAEERLRLLFQRSDLNKALFSFNWATEPTVVHGSIRLTVEESIVPPGCLVWYEFDRNLNLISAYAGDEFRGAHAQFYHNRKDDHTFTAEEQAAFQKVRCLVGCKSELVAVEMH